MRKILETHMQLFDKEARTSWAKYNVILLIEYFQTFKGTLTQNTSSLIQLLDMKGSTSWTKCNVVLLIEYFTPKHTHFSGRRGTEVLLFWAAAGAVVETYYGLYLTQKCWLVSLHLIVWSIIPFELPKSSYNKQATGYRKYFELRLKLH